MHLVVVLTVIIGLVLVGEFVERAVFAEDVLWNAVPGLVCLLAARKNVHLEQAALAVPCPRQVPGGEVRKGPVDVAVAFDHRQAPVEGPAVAQQTGTNLHVVPAGVERSVAVREGPIGLRVQRCGLQVQRGPESGRTVGRGAHAPLNLHIVDRGGEIGHIHPEYPVRFRVVQGDAVHGYVDAGRVHAADSDARITNTRARIRRAHYRRRVLQQPGDVLAEVVPLDLLAGHIGIGERFRLIHAVAADEHLISLHGHRNQHDTDLLVTDPRKGNGPGAVADVGYGQFRPPGL